MAAVFAVPALKWAMTALSVGSLGFVGTQQATKYAKLPTGNTGVKNDLPSYSRVKFGQEDLEVIPPPAQPQTLAPHAKLTASASSNKTSHAVFQTRHDDKAHSSAPGRKSADNESNKSPDPKGPKDNLWRHISFAAAGGLIGNRLDVIKLSSNVTYENLDGRRFSSPSNNETAYVHTADPSTLAFTTLSGGILGALISAHPWVGLPAAFVTLTGHHLLSDNKN